MNNTDNLIILLTDKNNTIACGAMKQLLEISSESDIVYGHFDYLYKLINNSNSYVRNRVIELLGANSKWDKEDKFKNIIKEYLLHINDEKPITARQCIKWLPEIAKNKPSLANVILKAIEQADTSSYNESMRPLVEKDLIEADKKIRRGLSSTLSPCGVVCTECEKYSAECAGCKTICGNVWWLEFTGQKICPFYDCCVNLNNLNNCGECNKFPCKLYETGDPTKSDDENAEILKKQIEALTGNI